MELEMINSKDTKGYFQKMFGCPKSILDYKKNMNGVDNADFYCVIYDRTE